MLTNFSTAARKLAAVPCENISTCRPVLSSEARVDVGVIAAAELGTAVPIVNWSGGPIRGLNLTLVFPCTFSHAYMASGAPVTATRLAQGQTLLTVDLGPAGDTVVLRL